MAKFNNAMEIFKLLDKSNCKKCSLPTCLAFAGAVFKGEITLDQCSSLDAETLKQHAGKTADSSTSPEQEMLKFVEQLKEKIKQTDISLAAQRLGEKFDNGRLTLKCLGKDISVDQNGNVTTDIHVHPWVTMPLFNYILYGKGTAPSGKWVPLRELKGGKDWYRLFAQRCEKPLKKVADTYTDLFEDMIHIFSGKQVENHYQSDISLVLLLFPKLPVLICYWKPDEGLESEMNLFFDSTAEEHLNIDSIYSVAAGLVMMFEKIALRHGIK